MKHKHAGSLIYVKFRKHKNAGILMKVPKAQKCLKFEDVYQHEAQKPGNLEIWNSRITKALESFRLKFPSDGQKYLKFVDFEAC